MKSLATAAPRARGVLLAIVIACSTLVGPSMANATPASDGLDRAERAHPMLQYGAQREPGKNVRVIAQLTAIPADPKAFAEAHDAKLKDTFPFIKSLVLELHFEDIAALAALPNVRYVSPDGTTKRKAVETDDLETVYAQTVGATHVWNNTSGLAATGKGVSVAILDTGVNTRHADFHRCTGPVEGDDWKDCPSNITTVRVHGKLGKDFDKETKDGNGHGTAVDRHPRRSGS